MTQDGARSQRWRVVLEVAATIAMIAASAVLIWAVLAARSPETQKGNRAREARPIAPSPPLPTAPISLDGASLQGKMSARIGVIEYSDFECPFCRKFVETTYRTVRTTYIEPGKILWAFRHFPLDARHPSAQRAAEAAECSRRQGKFWLMHDALFTAPVAIDADSVGTKAEAIGLDVDRFRQCMSGEATDAVRADVAAGQTLGISGTPTFLFGTVENGGRLKVVRREIGAIPTRAFAAILDELLGPVPPTAPR